MLKSILIGVDGSQCERATLELGLRWAQTFGAALFGLGVVDELAICSPEAVPLGGMAFKRHGDETRLAEARQKAEQSLQSIASRCADAGIAFTSLEAIGRPADQIVLEAQRYDLILLGQPKESDKTLREVVKHSPRPVVVVPNDARAGTAAVIAYDGSLQAARSLQACLAVQLKEFQNVYVICVHSDYAEAARRAERALAFLRFHDIHAQSVAFATTNEPAHRILQLANDVEAGLLVMGAYGQATLKEFFFGSVTRTVIDEARIPVFLYH